MPDVALCCSRDCLCVSCCCQICSLVPIKAPPAPHVKRHSRQKPPTDWNYYFAICMSCVLCPFWCIMMPFIWIFALIIDFLFWFLYIGSCFCCFQCKPTMRGPSIRYHTTHHKYSICGDMTCCHSTHHRFGRWEPINFLGCCEQGLSLRHPLFGYSGPIGTDSNLPVYQKTDPFICWCFNCCFLRHP